MPQGQARRGCAPREGRTRPAKSAGQYAVGQAQKKAAQMSGLFSVVVDCISRGTDARHQPCKVMIS